MTNIQESQRIYYERKKKRRHEEISEDPLATRLCSLCKKEVLLSEIVCSSNYCKQCRSQKTSRRAATLSGFMRKLYHHMKDRHEFLKQKGRFADTEQFLTFEELMDIYQQQNGYCYYFKTKKMNYIPGSEWMLSGTRLSTTAGYTKINVILCCFEFNTRNQWSLEKIQQITSLRHEMVDLENLEKEMHTTKHDTRIFVHKMHRTAVCTAGKRSKKGLGQRRV